MTQQNNTKSNDILKNTALQNETEQNNIKKNDIHQNITHQSDRQQEQHLSELLSSEHRSAEQHKSEFFFNMVRSVLLWYQCRAVLMMGKAQYSWPPWTNWFISDIENIIYVVYTNKQL